MCYGGGKGVVTAVTKVTVSRCMIVFVVLVCVIGQGASWTPPLPPLARARSSLLQQLQPPARPLCRARRARTLGRGQAHADGRKGAWQWAMGVPVEKFRKNYTPADYVAKDIDLTFQINDGSTTVVGKVKMRRRDGADASATLRLDAEDLDLRSVKIDSELLSADRYSFPEKDVLEIKGPFPEGNFELETQVIIKPEENTQLSGFYKTSGVYCTQVRQSRSQINLPQPNCTRISHPWRRLVHIT
jgi:hypothetical protein